MWKRIKNAISFKKRNKIAKDQRKRTSEIILAVFRRLLHCGTLQELEYYTGYYTGITDNSETAGEITKEQKRQILQVIRYISTGERERLENE